MLFLSNKINFTVKHPYQNLFIGFSIVLNFSRVLTISSCLIFQEFYTLKRRCSGHDGNSLKCFCLVAVCFMLLI